MTLNYVHFQQTYYKMTITKTHFARILPVYVAGTPLSQ